MAASPPLAGIYWLLLLRRSEFLVCRATHKPRRKQLADLWFALSVRCYFKYLIHSSLEGNLTLWKRERPRGWGDLRNRAGLLCVAEFSLFLQLGRELWVSKIQSRALSSCSCLLLIANQGSDFKKIEIWTSVLQIYFWAIHGVGIVAEILASVHQCQI